MALILSLAFASLLSAVIYFGFINSKETYKKILKLQAIYLAEAANSRALARFNTKQLPDYEDSEGEDEDEDEEDDWEYDEDWDEEDWEDEWSDDWDDWDEDDWEEFEQEEDDLLARIPRYINFYLKDPYYINIDTGHVLNEAQYLALIASQREELLKKKEEDLDYDINNEILIEELYFPLPEVNVKSIGDIDIPKGVHLNEGFKIELAEKVAVNLKQNDIRQEYLNLSPVLYEKRKTVLRNIEPNFGFAGELIDIFLDGENLDLEKPKFSNINIRILENDFNSITVGLDPKLKVGKYRLKWGSENADFYVVPFTEETFSTAQIADIWLEKPKEDGSTQFIELKATEKLENLMIIGQNLGSEGNMPLIIPDSKGFEIEIVSVLEDKITFNIKALKPSLGQHYISIFNKGGESNRWVFNVSPAEILDEEDPNIGVYSTTATLISLKSIPNISFTTELGSGLSAGRPNKSSNDSSRQDSGRVREDVKEGGLRSPRFTKNYNLLRSDLETVWKIETIAVINKTSYKETIIVNRQIPNIESALTSNSRLSFGTGDMKIQGVQEALSNLEEYYSRGEKILVVEGKTQEELDYEARQREQEGQDQPDMPTGSAVWEEFDFGTEGGGPSTKGFKEGAFVAIDSGVSSEEFTDFAIVESLGSNTIRVRDPGFQNSHRDGDAVIQFVPSVISPFGINKGDSQRHLEPPSSFISYEGKESFSTIFGSRYEELAHWIGISTKTSVPDDIYSDFEGYFGVNVIEGTPSYSGNNTLIGQGALIIDTTYGGLNKSGGTVNIGGSSKLPSVFEGVIYIIGDLNLSGNVEITGAIVVKSPNPNSNIQINSNGFIKYSKEHINKAIIGTPFTRSLMGRKIEKVKYEKPRTKKNN
jgi:hypothetical protein